MNTTTHPYHDSVGQRLVLRLKIDTFRGVDRASYCGDVRSAILVDERGVRFSSRIPDWGLTSREFRAVSATVSRVAYDGTVYLKNLRCKKS